MVVVLVVVMQFVEIDWALRQHTNDCNTQIDDVMLDWNTNIQHHRCESFLCSIQQGNYFLGFSQEGNRFDIGTEGPADEHGATTSGRTDNESVVQTCTMVLRKAVIPVVVIPFAAKFLCGGSMMIPNETIQIAKH